MRFVPIVAVLYWCLCSTSQAAPTNRNPASSTTVPMNSVQEYMKFVVQAALMLLQNAHRKVPFEWPDGMFAKYLEISQVELKKICSRGVSDEQLKPLNDEFIKLLYEYCELNGPHKPWELEGFLDKLYELDRKLQAVSAAQRFKIPCHKFEITEEQVLRVKHLESLLLKELHEQRLCYLKSALQVIRVTGICRDPAQNAAVSLSSASNQADDEKIHDLAQLVFNLLEKPFLHSNRTDPWTILERSISVMWEGVRSVEQRQVVPQIAALCFRKKYDAVLQEIRDQQNLTFPQILHYLRRIEQLNMEGSCLFSQYQQIPMTEEQTLCMKELDEAVVLKMQAHRHSELENWLHQQQAFSSEIPQKVKKAAMPQIVSVKQRNASTERIKNIEYALKIIKKLVDTANDIIRLLVCEGTQSLETDLLEQLQQCRQMLNETQPANVLSILQPQQLLNMEATDRNLTVQLQEARQQIMEKKLLDYLLNGGPCPLESSK